MRVLPYMDDFLVLTDSFEDGLLRRDRVRRVLNRLGLQRNEKKGQWEPVQVIEHLGLEYGVYENFTAERWRFSTSVLRNVERSSVRRCGLADVRLAGGDQLGEPPWALQNEVAHKLQEEGAAATVVAPYWPVFWEDDDKFYPGVVKSFNEDGATHEVYDDGDKESLNLSEEKCNILLSEGVYEQNMERGGDYKENKRGGDTPNFFARSLCGRWRDELGQSDYTDLAILMQQRSLLDSTLSNYGPKAERFVQFRVRQDRQWLPATEATVLVYLASLLETGNIKSALLQPYLSAINNYHEDLGLTGPAKGRAVTRAVKGMATIQAEVAVHEENIVTQRTWLPARHVRRVHEAALRLSLRLVSAIAVQHYIDPTAVRDVDMDYYFAWLTC
eukprot:gene4302-biopygen4234